MTEPLPEVVLIRIAAVVSAYMVKNDAHEALGEIAAMLEHAGVPWPHSPAERLVILDAWRRDYLSGGT